MKNIDKLREKESKLWWHLQFNPEDKEAIRKLAKTKEKLETLFGLEMYGIEGVEQYYPDDETVNIFDTAGYYSERAKMKKRAERLYRGYISFFKKKRMYVDLFYCLAGLGEINIDIARRAIKQALDHYSLSSLFASPLTIAVEIAEKTKDKKLIKRVEVARKKYCDARTEMIRPAIVACLNTKIQRR